MTEDLLRSRTDSVLGFLNGHDIDHSEYLSLVQKQGSLFDMALSTMIAPPSQSPYRMRDLNSPMPVSQMQIGSPFLAGHGKVSTNMMDDWPMADAGNAYGAHHPLSLKSGCCPLLHGGQHGEPEYAHHLIDSVSLLKEMAEQEKQIHGYETVRGYGKPNESMVDLYKKDRNRSAFQDENEWLEEKRAEFMSSFGMLSYLFGLEWNTPEQRAAFGDLLSRMGSTQPDSPEHKAIENKFQEKAGISWGRALRSWRSRFTPMVEWWMRPADRHGATSSSKFGGIDEHYHSPWEMGGNKSLNHHWWEPFLHWGGVGRGTDSLRQLMTDSYPQAFEGHVGTMLLDSVFEMMKQSQHHNSHFPASPMPHLNGGINSDSYTRKRGNWSAVSNHAYLHPSEIRGVGGRMQVPSDALLMTPLGRAIQSHTDVGNPRRGIYREEHPASTHDYWNAHNEHFKKTDMELGEMIMRLTSQAMQQFGPQIVTGTDPQSSTIARGNLQQIAAAANHLAIRKGGMSTQGLSPLAESVMPPVYVNGNNDAWGHEMPATLAWRFDPQSNTIRFDNKETPFTTMQRTVHEKHIPLPSMMSEELLPKQRDIYAMSATSPQGYSHLISGDLNKSDDYEPTGVFGKIMIEPAHTVYDLDDIHSLKGFSGDWIVQKKPMGKRVLVEKKGKRVKPMSLSSKIKKDLKQLSGDVSFDAYHDGDMLHVVDLLLHKGMDLSHEPLEDRMNALRTLYDSTEHLTFPMPQNFSSSDNEGLVKTVHKLQEGDCEMMIRDSRSTFIKGREVHPKWIRYASKDVKKQYPPLPQITAKSGTEVVLEYPSILSPVVIKGTMNGFTFKVSSVESDLPSLIKHAEKQAPLWSPVAFSLLKEAVTSATPGTFNPVHSGGIGRRPKKRKTDKTATVKAPAVIGDEEKRGDVNHIMEHVRRFIRREEKSMTTEELCDSVKGLTPKMLENFGNEYGIEEEDGKWTVNEAIDDDIIERFAYPRMNRASPDGGAWSGMQADTTSPRGPTQLMEEQNTTFGQPKEDDEEETMDEFPSLSLTVDPELTGGTPAQLTVEGDKAVLRIPKKDEDEEETQDIEPATRSEAERVA